MEAILKMHFLTLSNADIEFAKKKLTWRSHTVAKALPTIKRVKLIDKKEFAKAALNENSEIFVVYVATLEAPLSGMIIDPPQKAQIAALKQNEAPIKVSIEYSDFADVFLEKKALVLLKLTKYQYAIEL